MGLSPRTSKQLFSVFLLLLRQLTWVFLPLSVVFSQAVICFCHALIFMEELSKSGENALSVFADMAEM